MPIDAIKLASKGKTMIEVKGYFDGKKIHVLETIPDNIKPSEVTILFVESAEEKRMKLTEVRKKLRGSAKGLRLWEKLVADRKLEEDHG